MPSLEERIFYCGFYRYMSCDMTKPTKWVCAQRRLRSAWASAQSEQFAVRMKKAWVLSYPLSAQRRLWSDWGDRMPRLIWVFAGRTLILLVLSCRGSHNHSQNCVKFVSYCKNLKISDTRKFIVITLKVEEDGVSLEQCIQKMKRELQTV